MRTREAAVERILIIDDEASIRGVLRDLLEGEGFAVVEAPDGAVAMQRWREHPVDLVITDILMPEKDGLEVIREIRRAAPGTKVIAMSGGGGPKAQIRFLDMAGRLGAMRTIEKPFAMASFLETVRDVLRAQGPSAPAA